MPKRYVVELSDADRARAARLARWSGVPARVRTRAAVLLAAHDQMRDEEIAVRLGTSVATVQRTRRRYAAEGFDAAVGSVPRPEDPSEGRVGAVMALCRRIDGAVGAAVVDYHSGACLGREGAGDGLAAAAVLEAEAVRAKLSTIERLSLPDVLEDILVTLTGQYHLIRVLPGDRPLFVYVVLDRATGNLAMARHRLGEIEQGLAG